MCIRDRQSTNADVVSAVAKQAHFFRLSTPVQRVISSILHPSWRENYLNMHRQKLSLRACIARSVLTDIGVPVVASDAGLCLWIDLNEYLSSPDLRGEMELYQRLLNEHRIHISPGSGFKTSATGFFRLCFSQEQPILREGLRRLIVGLNTTATAVTELPEVFRLHRKTAG